VTILVVDDIRGTAESVAELIAAETGLRVHFESDPDAALTYAENNFLTVVVLDEQMPAMRGTELWGRMRRLNPLAVAVMLTQERSGDAVKRALNLGYSKHLWKNQIDELPATVLELHIQVTAAVAIRDTQDERQLVWRRRSLLRCRPEIWILSRTVIEARFVSPEWRDYVSVSSGQTVKATTQIRSTQSLVIERETTRQHSAELGSTLGFASLAAKLQASLTERETHSLSDERESIATLEVTYSLAPERPGEATKQVRSRSFEYSHVFSRERLVLSILCRGCGVDSKSVFVVQVPRDLVSTRQIDFFDDNTSAIVDTGFRRLEGNQTRAQ
jgi:CheY-like chemotaxis protein